MEVPIEISDLMTKCIKCGLCQDNCPSLRYGGCDPMAVMSGEDGNVVKCIGCGECSRSCDFTDPTYVMHFMRSKALGSKVPDIFLRTGFVLPQSDVSRSELKPQWEGNNYLMSGCTVESKAPFLIYAATLALNSVGEGCQELPKNSCCTYPIPFRQLTEKERDAYKHEIGNSSAGKNIITICPGCDAELNRSGVYAINFVNLMVKHADKIQVLKSTTLKVAIEPGCHYDTIYDDLVKIVKATGVEYIENKFGCCGKSIPVVSEGLMKERQKEMEGADVVIVACPMCFSRYDLVSNGIPVLHIVELIAMAAGDNSTLKYHNIKLKI
ncbi:MAG: (Fe-S)-binding protein [Candidatus Methanogranum gryphiswaldense]|nr:MAG: (Fe-S)-binding protein [Candidatus Methanogranum sp. U3.2.1]